MAKQRQCKGGVDSRYQASVKGRLALDLETSVEFERGAVDIDLIFFFFAELLLDLSWW